MAEQPGSPVTGEFSREDLLRLARFAEERAERVEAVDDAGALAELAREIEPLRGAVAAAAAQDEGELCARLALGLYPFLSRRVDRDEARATLRQALAAVTAEDPGACRLNAVAYRALEGSLRSRLAEVECEAGQVSLARSEAEAALELLRSLGDREEIERVEALLARLAAGDPARAK